MTGQNVILGRPNGCFIHPSVMLNYRTVLIYLLAAIRIIESLESRAPTKKAGRRVEFDNFSIV